MLSQDLDDALQAKVAHAVQNTGISKKLKAELRFQLIESLNNGAGKRGDRGGPVPAVAVPPPALAERALFSLVLEFLRKREKHYALSVLLPECGMGPGDVLTLEEIGQALSLQRVSVFQAALSSNEGGSPLLERLISGLATFREPLRSTSFTQTDSDAIGQSLEAKLAACYSKTEKSDRRSVEERMLQFQASCEARCRREAEAEIGRIRTIERERIALEEAAKARTELQEAKLRMEREAQERERQLRAREAAALERLRTKELELERRAVDWRSEAQRLLEDGTLRQSVRARKLDAEEQRLDAQRSMVERQELEVRDRERQLEARLKAQQVEHELQLRKCQIDASASFEGERNALRKREVDIERTVAQHAIEVERACELKERLAASERAATEALQEARSAEELAAARERELIECRRQLSLASDVGHQSQLAADRLRAQIAAVEQELEGMRSQKSLMQQSEGARQQATTKAVALLEAQVQSLQQENTRHLGELDRVSGQLQDAKVRREENEAKQREALEQAWQIERGALQTEVERLKQEQNRADQGEQRLYGELRRTQEQWRSARREAQELRWSLASEVEEARRVKRQLSAMPLTIVAPSVALPAHTPAPPPVLANTSTQELGRSQGPSLLPVAEPSPAPTPVPTQAPSPVPEPACEPAAFSKSAQAPALSEPASRHAASQELHEEPYTTQPLVTTAPAQLAEPGADAALAVPPSSPPAAPTSKSAPEAPSTLPTAAAPAQSNAPGREARAVSPKPPLPSAFEPYGAPLAYAVPVITAAAAPAEAPAQTTKSQAAAREEAEWRAAMEELEEELLGPSIPARSGPWFPSKVPRRVSSSEQARLEQDTRRLDGEISAFARSATAPPSGALATWNLEEEGVDHDLPDDYQHNRPALAAAAAYISQAPFAQTGASQMEPRLKVAASPELCRWSADRPQTTKPRPLDRSSLAEKTPIGQVVEAGTRAQLPETQMQRPFEDVSLGKASNQKPVAKLIAHSSDSKSSVTMPTRTSFGDEVQIVSASPVSASDPPSKGTSKQHFFAPNAETIDAGPFVNPAAAQVASLDARASLDSTAEHAPSASVPTAVTQECTFGSAGAMASDGPRKSHGNIGNDASSNDSEDAAPGSVAKHESAQDRLEQPNIVSDMCASDRKDLAPAASTNATAAHEAAEKRRPVSDMFADDSDDAELDVMTKPTVAQDRMEMRRPVNVMFASDSEDAAGEIESIPEAAQTVVEQPRPVNAILASGPDEGTTDNAGKSQAAHDPVERPRPVSDMFAGDSEDPASDEVAKPVAAQEHEERRRPVNAMFESDSEDAAPDVLARPAVPEGGDTDVGTGPAAAQENMEKPRPVSDMFASDSEDVNPDTVARPPAEQEHGEQRRPVSAMFASDSEDASVRAASPAKPEVVQGEGEQPTPVSDMFACGPEDARPDVIGKPGGAQEHEEQRRPVSAMFASDSEDAADDSVSKAQPRPAQEKVEQPRPVSDMFASDPEDAHPDGITRPGAMEDHEVARRPAAAMFASDSEEAAVESVSQAKPETAQEKVEHLRPVSDMFSSDSDDAHAGAMAKPAAVQPHEEERRPVSAMFASDSEDDSPGAGKKPADGPGEEAEEARSAQGEKHGDRSPQRAADEPPSAEVICVDAVSVGSSGEGSRSDGRGAALKLPLEQDLAASSEMHQSNVAEFCNDGVSESEELPQTRDRADDKVTSRLTQRSREEESSSDILSIPSLGLDGSKAEEKREGSGEADGAHVTETVVADEPSGAASERASPIEAADVGDATPRRDDDVGDRFQRAMQERIEQARLARAAEAREKPPSAPASVHDDEDEDEESGFVSGHESILGGSDASDAW